MVHRKAKGTRGERELVKFFNDAGWACIRSPGSGSSTYPSPDILAGNAVRRVAIECKVTKEKKKYFDKAEIAQLQEFSQKFGAESWVGVKFGREPWYFLLLEDLENTGNCWAASLEQVKRKGLMAPELLGKEKEENQQKGAQFVERFKSGVIRIKREHAPYPEKD